MLIDKTKVLSFYDQIKREPKYWKRKNKNKDWKISDWKISDKCSIVKSFNNDTGKYNYSITFPQLDYLVGVALTCKDIQLTIYAATMVAYAPAFQHVMKYKEKDLNKRILIREKGSEFAYSLFADFVSHDYDTFDDYWAKAEDVIISLRNFYVDMGEDDFSIGNAQKWFNMFIKHYYCLCAMNKVSDDIVAITESHLFEVASFAVDRIMIEGIILPQLGIDFKNYSDVGSWSKCNDVKAFESYERDVLSKVSALGYKSLFHWEFASWEPMKEFED